MKDWAESVTSGANMTGRLLVTFMIFCNIIAMVLYIIDVQSGLVEECVSWEEKVTIQIDFALGIIFTLHSLLRLTAAETFSSWLMSLPTIIDILTLPALFMSVWLKRTWIGCRYFRFCMLMVLPDVLVRNLSSSFHKEGLSISLLSRQIKLSLPKRFMTVRLFGYCLVPRHRKFNYVLSPPLLANFDYNTFENLQTHGLIQTLQYRIHAM